MGLFDILKGGGDRTGADNWREWASQKGWAFQQPASDLAGRFYPPLTARGAGEEYVFSVRGTHGGLDFVFFGRRWWVPSGREVEHEYTQHLAVELPHAPRADLRATSAEQAFKSLGASLAGRFGYDWHGDNWLLGEGRRIQPADVEGSLNQIANQVALAPPAVWATGS